jgi:hypothetical protein
MLESKYDSLGQQEGVGLLLLLSSLDVRGTGKLTAAEEELFLEKAAEYLDDTIGYFNSASVVATLTMAIAVPTGLYGLGRFNPNDESLGSGAVQTFSSWASSDAFYPLHWVEGVLIALSIYNATRAICLCFALTEAASFCLPDVEWRLRFFLDKRRLNVEVWTNVFFSIVCLLFGLPFLAARVSPVASICAGLPALGLVRVFVFDMLRNVGTPMARIQHECARRNINPPRGVSHADGSAVVSARVRDDGP